jgi:hypothetical protein
MSDRVKYDHATELSIYQAPVTKLAYLTEELKAWAKLNPGLVPLQEEFVRVLAEFREQEQARASSRRRPVPQMSPELEERFRRWCEENPPD